MASPKVSAMMTRHSAVSWPEKRIPRLSTAAQLAYRRECQYGNACVQKKVDKEVRTLYLICLEFGSTAVLLIFVKSGSIAPKTSAYSLW